MQDASSDNDVRFAGVILGGVSNTIFVDGFVGTESAILGGEGNQVTSGRTPVVVGEENQNATTDRQIVP